jgi:hypothetical protein
MSGRIEDHFKADFVLRRETTTGATSLMGKYRER